MPLTLNKNTTGATPAPTQTATKSDAEKFPALPDGEIVNAHVQRCQMRQAPDWRDYGQEVAFAFVIDDGPYKGRWMWGQTEARLDDDPSCTLTSWIKALIGVSTLPDDFEFIEDEYVGDHMTCKIQVRRYYSKKYDEFKNEVVAVIPAAAYNSAEEAF